MDIFMTDKTTYSDDFKQSSEFLRLAIALLAKHKIPADPHNYQLSYECVSGKNQTLSDDLSKLVEQSNVPSEKQLNSLYEHYFLQDEAFLEVMRQEIRQIIASIMEEFDYSGKHLSSYSQTLNQFIGILDGRNLIATWRLSFVS